MTILAISVLVVLGGVMLALSTRLYDGFGQAVIWVVFAGAVGMMLCILLPFPRSTILQVLASIGYVLAAAVLYWPLQYLTDFCVDWTIVGYGRLRQWWYIRRGEAVIAAEILPKSRHGLRLSDF